MKTTEKIMGLLMGVPTLGRPTNVQWSFALACLQPPINFTVASSIIWGREVADARNAVAEAAVAQNAKYVFFLGDDTEPPGHALKQLIYRLDHHPEIGVVGGIYVSKSDPPAPLVFRGNGAGSYWDWTLGEFFEVTGLGMDCTLIRTELLKQLPKPWFKTIKADSHLEGIAAQEAWTEDLYFCDRVLKETGFRIFADSMVMCKHWAYLGGCRWQDYVLRSDSLPVMRSRRMVPGGKQILDIGCGPVHWDFAGEGHVTTLDIREECCPDYRADVRQLPFGPDAFDVVFSSHTLEHLGRDETVPTLTEWLRVLKPGGSLRLIVPNIAWAAWQISSQMVEADPIPSNDVMNVLYGSQEYAENFHKTGFTPGGLKKLLTDLGLCQIEVLESGYNILIEGIKPDGVPSGLDRKQDQQHLHTDSQQ